MVNAPCFILHASELRSLKQHIKIGLHFNLTEGYLIIRARKTLFSLNELLIKTHMRSIKLSSIAKEFSAQLDQFIEVIGRLPDFIDGHQHVHQFPIIRQIILIFMREVESVMELSIRSTWPSINLPEHQFKAKVLGFTGGKILHKQLLKLGIPHNGYFSGIYDFAPGTNYRDLFRKWLNLAKENTLIMCHPGEGSGSTDSIAQARSMELDYFLSDEFLNDCNENYVHLA